MASIIAVVMIGLVAIALVTLGAAFSSQLKRTRAAAADTQLRQLLTAGAAIATQSAADDQDVALPKELADDGASLHVSIRRDGERATAEINAKLRERSMNQTLHLERRDGTWKITDAALNANHAPPATQPSERSTAASQRS